MKNKFFRAIALCLIAIISLSLIVYAEENLEESEEQIMEDSFAGEGYVDGFKDIFDVEKPSQTQSEVEMETTEEIVEPEYSKMSLPKAMGIMGEYTDAEMLVTRAEAAEYVAKLAGYEQGMSDESVSYFSDVSLLNERLCYINYVKVRGIMGGSDDGLFKPEEHISAAEMAACVLRTAGYSEYARVIGDYPSGYAKAANRLGIFDDTKLSFYSTEINYQQMEKIIENALHMPIYEISSIVKSDDESFVIGSDQNRILMNSLDVYVQEAMLCATEHVYLNGCSETVENEILLSTKTGKARFQTRVIELETYLGIQGDYYYLKSQDDAIGTVIYADGFNDFEVVELGYWDIFEVSADRREIKYEYNQRTKELKVAYDAVFIYNGRRYDTMSVEDIYHERSRVVFTDCNDDGEFDIVSVRHYETLFVDVVSDPIYTWDVMNRNQYPLNGFLLHSDKLYAAYESGEGLLRSCAVSDKTTGKAMKLDMNSDEYDLSVYKSGASVGYADVSVGDFLLIYESKDKELKKVVVSNKAIAGKVNSIYTNNQALEINEERYECAFSISSNLLSKVITAFMDEWGNIADYRSNIVVTYADGKTEIEEVDTEIVYGYLMGTDVTTIFDDKVKCKIFTMDQVAVIFDVCDKILLNGESKRAIELVNHFNLTGHQLIKYQLNEEGKVKKIYTSTAPEGYVINGEKPIFSMNAHYNDGTEHAIAGEYRASNINGEYNVQNAQRMVVVVDENGELIDDRIFLTNSFKSYAKPDIRVYDATTGKIAGFLVMTMQVKDANLYSGIGRLYFLVGEKIAKLDKEGNPVNVLVGISGQYIEEYCETPDVDFDDIYPGDILQIEWYEQRNGMRFIRKYQKLVTLKQSESDDPTSTFCDDYAYTKEAPSVKQGWNVHAHLIYGDVANIGNRTSDNDMITNNAILCIRPLGGDDDDIKAFTMKIKEYQKLWAARFNVERGTYERIEPEEITPGSRIFVATNYYEAQFAVVYE